MPGRLRVSQPSYHVRWRGIVTGPYTFGRISRLIADDRLSATCQVSADGETWQSWRDLEARLRGQVEAPLPGAPPNTVGEYGRQKAPAAGAMSLMEDSPDDAPTADHAPPPDLAVRAPCLSSAPPPVAADGSQMRSSWLAVPLAALFRGHVLENRGVLVGLLLSICPLALSLFHFSIGWGFERSAWILGAYFCLVWALVFYRVISPSAPTLRRGVMFAMFTAFVGIPLLLFWQRLYSMDTLASLGLASNSVVRFTFFVLVVGVFEEACKAFPILVFALRKSALQSLGDGVFLGVMSGLGFAWNESVRYSILYWNASGAMGVDRVVKELNASVLASNSPAALQEGLARSVHDLFQQYGSMLLIQLVRLISLPLLHAAWAGIVGYFCAVACRQNRWGLVMLGIGISAMLHGAYNTWSDSIMGLQVATLSVVILFSCIVSHMQATAPRPAEVCGERR